MVQGHLGGDGLDGTDGGHRHLVRRDGAVQIYVEILLIDVGIVVLSVDGTDHRHLVLYVAHVILKVGAVEHVAVQPVGGVPHIVGQHARAGDGHLIAVVVGVGAIVAGAGDVGKHLVIGGVKGLLQDGGVVALEHHHLQVVTVVERLVAHRRHRIGQGDQLGVAAGKGHGGHTHRILGHRGGQGRGAQIGDQHQAGVHRAVQGAVDDPHRLAQVVGKDRLLPLVVALAGFFYPAEGLQHTQGKGVIPHRLQVLAQGDGKGRVRLFHKGVVADGLGAGQVRAGQGGIGKAVVTDGGDRIHIGNGGQGLAIGEGTLADLHALGVEGHRGQRPVVHKGVFADLLGGGQIHRRQRTALGKGVFAHRLHLGRVDIGQGDAAGKGVGLDLIDLVAQLDRHHIPAIGKGVLADLLGGGQVGRRDPGGVIGIHIVAVAIHRRHAHLVVQTHKVHVAGQGVVAHLGDRGQVDLFQAGVVVKGHLAQLGAGAQGDLFQAGRIGKGGLADVGVVTDGDGGQGGAEGVIEIPLAVPVQSLHRKGGVLIHTKGVFAQSDVVAHHHGGQLLTLAEHALGHLHLIRDGDLGDGGKGKGVSADLGLGIKGGQGGDGGLEEGVFADLLQSAQGDGGQLAGGAKGIVPQLGDLGQVDLGHLDPVGEGALGHGGDCGAADLLGTHGAGHGGRHRHQRLSVGREDVAGGLLLKGLVALFHLKGGHLGGAEGKRTDVVDVRADGHLSQRLTLVEHTLRQHRRIHVELGQALAAGKGVGTVLDQAGGDRHVLQALAAGKGVLADGQQAVAGDHLLQILIARKGIVGDDAGGGQLHRLLQVALFKGVLVDDLQVVVTAEGDLLQRGAAVEGAVFDGGQGGG